MSNNNTIEEIVSSVKEEALGKVAQAVRNKIVARVAQSAQGKLIIHVDTLVTEIKGLLKSNKADIDDVITMLEQKNTEVQKDKNKREQRFTDLHTKVINALKDMAKATQKVEVLNPITKQQVTEAMSESLDVISNILTKANELPNTISYSYNAQGKLNQIVERFEGYTLTTSIRYTNGKVSSSTLTRT